MASIAGPSTRYDDVQFRNQSSATASSTAIPEHEEFDLDDSSTTRAVPAQSLDATIPDGGYGWTIVLCCSIIAFWFVGTSYSWGVMQKKLVSEHVGFASTLSFVGGLTPMCISVFAILNARLLMAVGARWTGLAGVALLGVGGVLASFAPKSVAGLFVFVGVVEGLGTSLCFMAISVTPAQYFYRKRGLANGIVYAGGGIGGTVISLSMERLLEQTDLSWTFRIIGIITLASGLPAAWFLKERIPVARKTFIEWELFKDIKFTGLFLASAIGTFPLFVPPFFLPLYSESVGLSASTGAALVAGFNLSSAVGRIGFGVFSDWIGPLHALAFSLLLSAVSMLTIWPVSTDIGPLILFVIINGAANGGFFSAIPTTVGSMFGSARVTVAMGMVVTGWAGGYLMGGPIAGYILEASGGEEAGFKAYRPAMYYAGSMSMAAAILLIMLRFRIDGRWKTKI